MGDKVYYTGPRRITAASNSTLSQTVTLPPAMTTPILSFFYDFPDGGPVDGASFEVQVTQGTTTTSLLSTTSKTAGWTHGWFDLSPWAGQEITLGFKVHLPAGKFPAYALVDDVTIGSANLDVWVSDAGPGVALPSSTTTLALAYGNQGLVPAEGVTVTATLPDKLTFISADLEPASINGQVLTWDAGTLAGDSGPFTIHITATVAEDAALLSTLDGSLQIATTSPELETANNTFQTHIFIGTRVLLPVIAR